MKAEPAIAARLSDERWCADFARSTAIDEDIDVDGVIDVVEALATALRLQATSDRLEIVNKPVDDVVHAAMKLPPRQRRAAVEKIIIETSAQGDGTSQVEIDRLWAAEIDRRVKAIRRDPTRGLSLAASEKLVDEELARRRSARELLDPPPQLAQC